MAERSSMNYADTGSVSAHGGRPMTLRECMEAEEPAGAEVTELHTQDGWDWPNGVSDERWPAGEPDPQSIAEDGG